MNELKRNFLKDTIKKLYYDEKWNQKSAKYYGDQFVQYYREGQCNLYSPTYQIIADLDEDGSEILDYRLGKVQDYIMEHHSNYAVHFIKLRDYIVLEASRAQTQSSLDKHVQETLQQSVSEVEKLEKLAEEYETSRKDSATQTITILSIFTGIAMAFFGGFSLLGSAFNNLDKGIWKVAVIAALVGFVLFNTIFAFLYMAGKISGKSFAMCKCDNCQECLDESKCKWFLRGFKRFPYITAINSVILVLLFIFMLCA